MGKFKMTGYPSIDKPWLKYYSEEIISAPLPECTIYEYLIENNKDFPDDIAIRYFAHRITYRELFENIDCCANALSVIGVKPGEIVTIALPSIPEALYLIYSLNKIGAVANVIHPLAGENEIINYFNEVDSRVVFIFDGTYQLIKESISKTNVSKAIVITAGESLPIGLKQIYFLKNKRPKFTNDRFYAWGQFIANGREADTPDIKKDSGTIAIISHTGGTTGEPKGVMLSDKSINAMIWQIGRLLSVVRQESQLAVLPPFVNYSLVNAMLEPITLGNTSILIPDYKADQFSKYARKYKPTYVSSIPAYWEVLLKDKTIRTVDLSFLRCPFYGGEKMNESNEKAVNKLLHECGAPNELANGLGATELVSAATLTPYDNIVPESAGIPLPRVNCKIVIPGTVDEVLIGNVGEICFSGTTVMLGYYNNKEATDEIVKTHSDGARWLHTGDLGYMDENGYLFVTGRIKRIFMTKGRDKQITKVFPDRIEAVLSEHPAIELCCVIAVPDEDRINYPMAYLVMRKDMSKSDYIMSEIQDICHKELPEYMIPEKMEFMDDLPRTERGKIDYRALEEMAKKTASN